MCETDCSAAKSYYTKVSELRADVHTKDWADDKRLSLGSYGGYGYLSMDKIVKQIAPLFNKHGLEIELEYSDLQQIPTVDADNDKYHWTVRLSVTLVDIDTGFKGAPMFVMGESVDRGDKGVSKAQTSAYKNWHIKFFDLADGIDPDSDSVEAQEIRKFTRSEAEKEEVTSKVLNAAKKSVGPTKSPSYLESLAKQVQEEDAAKAATETSSEEVSAPEAEPDDAEQVSPAKPASVDGPKFEPKVPQKKAIEGILKTWETLAKDGKVTPAEYNEMSGAYTTIDSDASAVAFIRKYRRNL